MELHLRAAGRAGTRLAAGDRRPPWAGMLLAAGSIAFAIGAAMLMTSLAPMFVQPAGSTPAVATLAPLPATTSDPSIVVAPAPAPALPGPSPEALARPAAPVAPTDGVSFVMRVPAVGYSAVVRQGVSLSVLNSGPGHYSGTPWPGQAGNVGVAGHNTFWLSFNRLKAGDRVEIRTQHALFVYEVTGSRVVDPGDRTVLAPTLDHRLTLTTCYPLWAGALATKRLVFTAQLVGGVA
jgi:sortase A